MTFMVVFRPGNTKWTPILALKTSFDLKLETLYELWLCICIPEMEIFYMNPKNVVPICKIFAFFDQNIQTT